MDQFKHPGKEEAMKRQISLVGCILALFVLAAVCPSWAQSTLKVGAMFSQTGAGSAVGKIQIEAVKLAVKELNDKGGVTLGGKKMKVEAVLRDDETKPDVAVRRLREYQNDGVNLLVAGTFAHVSQALNEQVKGADLCHRPQRNQEDLKRRKGSFLAHFGRRGPSESAAIM
jgi:ABC-type branched-subunit amino acid transport system substrate-binding protein